MLKYGKEIFFFPRAKNIAFGTYARILQHLQLLALYPWLRWRKPSSCRKRCNKNMTKREKDKQIPGKGKSAIVGACCIKLAECSPFPDPHSFSLVSQQDALAGGRRVKDGFLWRSKNELNIYSKERKTIKIPEFSSRSTEFFCNFRFVFQRLFAFVFFVFFIVLIFSFLCFEKETYFWQIFYCANPWPLFVTLTAEINNFCLIPLVSFFLKKAIRMQFSLTMNRSRPTWVIHYSYSE